MAGVEQVTCATYTHARRHPKLIGVVGGWPLPTGPVTFTQVGVFLAVAALLWATRGVWAVLPGLADLLVGASLPLAAAWAVRQVRIEGRPPLRAAAGLARYLAAPAAGVRQGRPGWRPRVVVLRGARLWVAHASGGGGGR